MLNLIHYTISKIISFDFLGHCGFVGSSSSSDIVIIPKNDTRRVKKY
jgi:hypothetical protein